MSIFFFTFISTSDNVSVARLATCFPSVVLFRLFGLEFKLRTLPACQRSILVSGLKSSKLGPSSLICKSVSRQSRIRLERQSVFTLFIRGNIRSSFAFVNGQKFENIQNVSKIYSANLLNFWKFLSRTIKTLPQFVIRGGLIRALSGNVFSF